MNLQHITVTAIILLITEIDLLYGNEVTFKCGSRLVKHESLITHGHESIEGSWPWHAAIFHIKTDRNIAYKCGGSIIASNAILTAAHCVYENKGLIVPDRVLIELGKHNLKIISEHTKQFEAFKIIPHPYYNHKSDENNDIAIIKLATEVTFTNYIQPICLWDSNEIDISNVIGKNGHVIGWGITETDKLSVILRQAVMPVVSLATCLDSNRPFYGNFLTDQNFCAGFRNGTSVCNGDSGGSMTFLDNGVYRIRGIVSLSSAREDRNICNTDDYVIFTDVAKYLSWIVEVIPSLRSEPVPGSATIKTVNNTYGNKTFYAGLTEVNFYQAIQQCAMMGYRLAAIESEGESRVVEKMINTSELKNKRFWISANSLFGSPKTWYWLLNGKPLTFTNWGPGEPRGWEDEDCAEMWRGEFYEYSEFTCNDLACSYKRSYICENEAVAACGR